MARRRRAAPGRILGDLVTHKMWDSWATGGTGMARAFTSAPLGRQWHKAAWGADAYAKFESEGAASSHSFARDVKLGYEPANRAKSQMLRFVGRADWSGASGLEARVEVAFIHLIGCCAVNAAPCTSELAAEVLGALPADAFGECHVGGSAEVQVALRDCWEAFVSADMDGQRRRALRGVLLTKDGGRDFLMRVASGWIAGLSPSTHLAPSQRTAGGPGRTGPR